MDTQQYPKLYATRLLGRYGIVVTSISVILTGAFILGGRARLDIDCLPNVRVQSCKDMGTLH